MRKFNLALLTVLVIQIVLVAVMYGRQPPAAAAPAGPWVHIDRNHLDKLTITGGDGKSVTLEHGHNGWVVPAKSNFPANQEQLKSLVDHLDDARPDLPVAVSQDARERFHVAKDKFERHLVFTTAKGRTTSLYLGKSAGAGRLYARLAGTDAIMDIRFPLWRAGTSASDWLDKKSLDFPPAKQTRIALPHVTLVRNKDLWQPQGLADGREPDHAAIQTLLDQVSALRWDTLKGKASDAHLPAHATFTMTVTPKQGAARVYRFYKRPAATGKSDQTKNEKAKPTWWVTRSDSDFAFTIGDDQVEPLFQADPASLSRAKSKKNTDQHGKTGKPADKSAAQ